MRCTEQQMHKIYTLWWQGFDNAPDIVKICHESLRRIADSKTQEVIALDEHSLFHYVDLPGYIMDKFRRGNISVTHFSDIVRSVLLSQTGGLWTDATMFFTVPLDEAILRRDFFTMKNPDAKWTGFFIGGQANFPLFRFWTDFWLEYWKQEEELITYFLIDHVLMIAYRENQRVREAIDSNPFSFHYKVDYFQHFLSRPYDETQYREIICNEPYLKLSYKAPLYEAVRNRETFYGFLKRGYLC